ncbi:MAG: hypothetical protein ABL962_02970, partial [Fimbriimonadaceae bacterium]
MAMGGLRRSISLLAALSAATFGLAQFNDSEKGKIQAYWSGQDRYKIGTPEAHKNAPYQVRLTPEGSLWLWAYNQKRGLGKVFQTPAPQNESQREWETWIENKVAYDRYVAQIGANVTNKALGFSEQPTAPVPSPGPVPEGLRFLVGDAPLFASAVQPNLHEVCFHDGVTLRLTDNPAMRPRYAYYRWSEGVMSGGTQVKKLPQATLDTLFAKAGVGDSVQRVMKAVSLLEGGFDSINTYDTGFVSVGFIQFACLSKGAGSLGSVLLKLKQTDASAFNTDFRQFGIDVTSDGQLVALNLATAETTTGLDAAKMIIKDKRLIAVFQRAGQVSDAFKVAQLQVAKDQYYPEQDSVILSLGNQPVTAKVSDFVKSEAGIATLMDWKVNTGKLGDLVGKANAIVRSNGLKSVSELAEFEADLVRQMRFRKDFLGDETLSQPVAKKHRPTSKSSR